MRVATVGLLCGVLFALAFTASGQGQGKKLKDEDRRFVIVFEKTAKRQDAKEVNRWLKGKNHKTRLFNNAPIIVVEGKLTQKRIDRLLRNKKIQSIGEDHMVNAGDSCNVRAVATTIEEANDMMDGVSNNQMRFDMANTARDTVDIYVLDGGILETHDEFQTGSGSRVSLLWDFYNSTQAYTPHGTKVAGLAAGKYWGMDPNANIIDIRIFNHLGQGWIINGADGIDRALDNHLLKPAGQKSVLVMSFGVHIATHTPLHTPSLNAIQALVQIAAATPGVYMTTSAGNAAALGSEYSPCVHPEVICAGSVGKTNAFMAWSSYGSALDILAQGDDVYGASNGHNNHAEEFSGTSASNALVGGLVSLKVSDDVGNQPTQASIISFFKTNSGTVSGWGNPAANPGTTSDVIKYPTC